MYTAVFVVSLADVLLTWLGLEMGFIREANPFMAAVFDVSGFAAAKLTVVIVGATLVLLHRNSERIWWVKHAVAGLLIVRLGVLLLHVPWLAFAAVVAMR